MIDAAAFAVTADLLAVVADLPAATARHAELAKLMARADVAEATLARNRQEFAQHQAGARTTLAKLGAAVAAQRALTTGAEGHVQRQEAEVISAEKDWEGLGLPQDVPDNRPN
jgi:hypothetical protein